MTVKKTWYIVLVTYNDQSHKENERLIRESSKHESVDIKRWGQVLRGVTCPLFTHVVILISASSKLSILQFNQSVKKGLTIHWYKLH
jgi:hypothetical protein